MLVDFSFLDKEKDYQWLILKKIGLLTIFNKKINI